MWRKLYPLEKATLLYLGSFLAFALFLNLKIYLPNNFLDGKLTNHFWGIMKNGQAGVLTGYFTRLFLGYLAYFTAELIKNLHRKNSNKNSIRQIFTNASFEYARIIAVFTTCLFIMMNFKLWALLLQNNLYDNIFHNIDSYLWPINNGFKFIVNILGLTDKYYLSIFGDMFLFSILLSGLWGKRGLHRIITTMVVIFILGGLAYLITPAYGPFVFGFSESNSFAQTHIYMQNFSDQFRLSKGLTFDAKDFAAPLGAMPSLHAAHAIAIAYNMTKLNKYIGIVFCIAAAYICVFAALSQFHYIIDIIAGIIIAMTAITISNRLTRGIR